ncbi:MAG TPA: crossover junction endodeoxyribonuclease RuvC [Bdellovibrionota bacterium]|nr:crossover junction endodeoxyribonuclease RuvC [Bdellovibrionota bacterium]
MRVLGVDPGSRVTGWGIIRREGNRIIHEVHGTIPLNPDDPFPIRLKILFERLKEVIVTHQPQTLSLEKIFVAHNASSALKLGQARGVVMAVGAIQNLEIFEYSPTEIKQALVGYGHATKIQMQKMIKTILGLPELPKPDAADALAVGICHLQQSRLTSLVKGADKSRDRISSWATTSPRPK